MNGRELGELRGNCGDRLSEGKCKGSVRRGSRRGKSLKFGEEK